MELEIGIEDILKKEKIKSDRIEFKEGWNPDDIYCSICAIANDYNNEGGGYIIVGVQEIEGMTVRPVKGIPGIGSFYIPEDNHGRQEIYLQVLSK